MKGARVGNNLKFAPMVPAPLEADHPQEWRGCFDLLGPHNGLELPGHVYRLRGQVLHKVRHKRRWLCPGPRPGLLLLAVGGAPVSSRQDARICYDVQLILAYMSLTRYGQEIE